jgi:zinc transport system ATP-binding protein
MYDIMINNLEVKYGDVIALKNGNLNVRSKAFLGIIGPNGGGKTTLFKVILGLKKPDSGKVIVKENLKIGYVPQTTVFDKSFPVLVKDVILMGRLDKKFKLFQRFSSSDKKTAEEIMRKLDIYHLKDRQIGELSGGQLQRVLIGRTLVNNPDVLLLDEPTSSLDSKAKKEIFDLLKELNKEKTVVVITHDMEYIYKYIDSIACVNQSIHYHDEDENITEDNLKDVYNCPINLLLQSGAVQKRMMKGEGTDND